MGRLRLGFKSLLHVTDSTPCPLLPQFYPDIASRKELSRVIVKCYYADQGCCWCGLLKEINVSPPPVHNPSIHMTLHPPSSPSPPQTHMEVCVFEKVKCGLCHERVRACYLEQHMANECPERTISCGYCTANVTSKALQVSTQRH